jgi:metal-dependent HD superfamily phosphatase/phosphodiesterase
MPQLRFGVVAQQLGTSTGVTRVSEPTDLISGRNRVPALVSPGNIAVDTLFGDAQNLQRAEIQRAVGPFLRHDPALDSTRRSND